MKDKQYILITLSIIASILILIPSCTNVQKGIPITILINETPTGSDTPIAVEEICDNGIDDDGDGRVDENCEPENPGGGPEEICDNGKDDDDDGNIDAADSDCLPTPIKPTEVEISPLYISHNVEFRCRGYVLEQAILALEVSGGIPPYNITPNFIRVELDKPLTILVRSNTPDGQPSRSVVIIVTSNELPCGGIPQKSQTPTAVPTFTPIPTPTEQPPLSNNPTVVATTIGATITCLGTVIAALIALMSKRSNSIKDSKSTQSKNLTSNKKNKQEKKNGRKKQNTSK